MLKREITATFAGNLAAAAVGLGTSILFARVLGRDGQGLLALALFLPTIVATFAPLGLDMVNTTFGGLHKDERRGLFLQSILAALFGTAVVVLVTAAYFFWLPIDRGEFGRLPHEIVWLACLAAPLTVLSGTLSALVRGVGRITTSAALVMVPQAATLVLAGALFLGTEWGLMAALVASVAGLVVSTGLSIWILRDYATLRPSALSWNLLKRSLGFGWQVGLASLAGFLVYRINQGILGYMAPADQIGMFVVAVGLAERLRIVPGSLGQAFLPRLANELAERQGQVPAVFRYSVIISVLSMIGVGLAGIPAILIFFGWAYAGSVPPFLIMLPGIAALGGASVLASDLMARKKPKFGLYLSYIMLVANFGLNMLLIPFIGINGAALASTISYMAALVLWILFYRRESKTLLADLVPRWSDVVYLWHAGWGMLADMSRWVRRRLAGQLASPAEPPERR
jgi:stage V sporulation protein B